MDMSTTVREFIQDLHELSIFGVRHLYRGGGKSSVEDDVQLFSPLILCLNIYLTDETSSKVRIEVPMTTINS